MTTKAFPELFAQIDAAIRGGNSRHARSLLLHQKIRAIPREAKREFARLCRRAHLNTLALKVLNPIVRPSGGKLSTATELEKAEYAAALTYVGTTQEARGILKTLHADRNAEVYLLHAFALFAEWRYGEAVPLLESYVKAPGLNDYARLIGRTNLAAALVYERHSRADTVLDELFREATPKTNPLVYGYALKLVAEKQVNEKKWKEARASLAKAQSFFPSTDSLEALFIRKWLAIVELYEKPSRGTKAFDEIREEALKLRHWETLRSSDYHVAVATKDANVIHRFLFGTPFDSLKQKLLADLGREVKLPAAYDWELKSGAKVKVLAFDDLVREKRGHLKAGQALSRLVAVLCTDFYRPFRSAELHAKLYEAEYFNPVTSPHRVAQLISRLRGVWAKEKCPLEVAIAKGQYSLASKVPLAVRLPKDLKPAGSGVVRLDRLRAELAAKPFSIQDVCRVLDLPAWTAKRLLKDAQAKGELLRKGAGKGTSYLFKSGKG